MKTKLLMAAWILVLAGCAGSSFKVPLSTDDPPPPNAAVDEHCMEDCLGDGTNAAICHSRCAK
jgi:hypothetical protein